MYCANCGKKIPDDSKSCPGCGGNASEKPISGKKRKIRWPILIIGLVIIFGLVPAVIYYFAVLQNIAIYTHPLVGFTFAYSKDLTLETPTLPAGSNCPAEPCLIVLKDPAYDNEGVNWIFIIPIAYMGGDKAKLQTLLDEDIAKGWATAVTVNGIKMAKYVNDPANPIEEIIALYEMMGLDPSREQSVYEFLADDSAITVGFRMPPTGAPAGYDLYLDISSWRNQSTAE